ncbi:AAA family ATPase [Carnobacterium inhibens]|uniref:AAA family ATPase n=1 Tax=Carnobacterium inhibens TaxID=147709 RepID=A0ABR7TCI1_9LACT|nr:AAA family ATPase [Carnobacterium inhibens]MBC9825387.1 AAA family ATPase [Carnobacterium inhibens]
MYIKNLRINNLYGKDYDLYFNKKLTILYGLNGSGKTTILNIINNLSLGNVEELKKYKFSYIRCVINTNNYESTIEIYKRDELFTVEIDNRVVYESSERNEKHSLNFYSGEYAEIDSNKRINTRTRENFGKQLDTIYLPIDRKISGTALGFKSPKNRRMYASNKTIEVANIDHSLKVAQAYFKDHRYFVKETSSAIQNQIERNMLEEMSLPVYEKINDLTEEQLSNLIQFYKKTFENKDIHRNIVNLINRYSKLKTKINGPDLYYISLQLNKLNNVMMKIADQKKYLDNLENTERDLMNEINSYFIDTDKSIKYSKSTLSFSDALHFINKSDFDKEPLSLSYLSSGEKQLIILLIFSILNIETNKNEKIFMVDEPELSLHVAWQKRLLDTILRYSKNTQIIIATHSPDIINGYYDYVYEVRGR